ncbi:MAG TPA: sensor histidine kinase [Actinomycetes bacterium]|nr:sensor histidine kinase [Actinomycetes bacterium]
MAPIASRLRLPVQVQDAMLAVFVTLFQILGTVRAAGNQPAAQPLTDPDWLGYVLLTATGLALVVRRRWPVAVLATTVAISLVYYTAHYPDGPGTVGLFVAIYTVAAEGDGQRSLRLVTVAIAVLTVGWLLAADLQPFNAAGWMLFRIGTAVMAAALGESVRTRRALATEAQQRAERAERTREQEARRRVDAERLRIAREVHDTVAHAIAVINVQAGVTAHVLDRRPQQARETLVTIEQTSARALGELRAILGVLRDPDDGDAPAPGLRRVEELAGMARQAGLDVEVEVGAPPRELPSAVDQAAYRIVQEAITNVIRHAGRARVLVSVSYGPGDLELRVADDGRGPSGGADRAGRGIVGMRERAGLLGGELTAGPRPGGGFQVLARLPLPPRAAVSR